MSRKAKKKSLNENSAIRSGLRRIFSRSPVVKEVLNQNRRTVPRMKKDGTPHAVPSVQFQCAICQSWVPRKEIEVDHIEPVIPTNASFSDWDTFIKRLFCDKSNLRCLCIPCHKQVTRDQREERAQCLAAESG